jgi:hypothetical protein
VEYISVGLYSSDVLFVCLIISIGDNCRTIIARHVKFCQEVHYKRAVCKVHGLTLLLRVGTLWRCGDGLFFEVPPLTSDALLTTLHPLLENVLQTVDYFEISCLRAPFS